MRKTAATATQQKLDQDFAVYRQDAESTAAMRGMTVRWLVTKPGPDSTIFDICWPCDWTSLEYAFKGGLTGAEVYGLYAHEQQARNVAQSLLDVRDGKLDPAMVR